MQTVKNIYLWPGRSYLRKFLEIPMALAANIIWQKERTLELYLNVIEWGEGIYGVKAAAKHYYKKPLGMLTKAEAAALAVMLPNPRKMSPQRLSPSAKRQMGRLVREMG
jgi:monofunctional glycosyltransferase